MEAKILDKPEGIDLPLIGIPVHNDIKPFKRMIESLLCSTAYFEKIIIIESGSTDGCKEYCDRLASWNKKIEVIHTKKEGPLNAYNKLFEIAKQENKDLFITQTDVLFPELYERDWLEMMSKIANMNEVGLVVPINGGGFSGPDYLDGMYWVGGWATYISKKCWEVFDGYDEKYPKGYGVDIDMTYLISKKYKVFRANYWVHHHQMNSREHDMSPDSENAKKDAGKYFRQKWGLD